MATLVSQQERILSLGIIGAKLEKLSQACQVQSSVMDLCKLSLKNQEFTFKRTLNASTELASFKRNVFAIAGVKNGRAWEFYDECYNGNTKVSGSTFGLTFVTTSKNTRR